jgi:two-component sensor histidine kinase
VKYGALSTSEGRIDFTWRLSKGRGPRELAATWREVDGPRVRPPTRAGFGTRLIERGLAADLNGDVRIDYPVDGVICSIRARLDSDDDRPLSERKTPDGPDQASPASPAQASPPA